MAFDIGFNMLSYSKIQNLFLHLQNISNEIIKQSEKFYIVGII